MIILWDEPKRLVNLRKHGLDFADLSEVFFAHARFRPAKRGRIAAIGALGNGTVAVIFVLLGPEAISIVSMRPANLKERQSLKWPKER